MVEEFMQKDEEELVQTISRLKAEIETAEAKRLALASALYYKSLLKDGVSPMKAARFAEEDRLLLSRAADYKATFNGLRDTFFGYPGNLNSDSPIVRHLRKEEAEMYYSNNAGDPYGEANVSMDGKAFEREILKLFYTKFGIDEKSGWGYITSGGSESNIWGIRAGFNKYASGRLYFCEAAHYGVEKAVTNGERAIYPYTILPKTSGKSEKINRTELINKAVQNYRVNGEPAILLLTWGTTRLGSVDDVQEITNELKREQIPYYCHVDAAFYGGIPNNQIGAPVCPSLSAMGADSVSVSFHKFFGIPSINSIVLSKDKASGKEISYLGHPDTTVLGSRTFPVFSAYQRIKEILERSPEDYFIRNVRYFQNRLDESGLSYFRDGASNIFAIPRPDGAILKQFQLPVFEGQDGELSIAHAIINPFHSKEEIDALFNKICDDQKKHKRVF